MWDGETGFGGDGNPRKGESIAQGHCIENGPFTELEVPYFDMIYHPHCLSRGFQSGQGLKNLSSKLSPEALDNILESRDYDTFNLGLEHGAHLAVPRSIRGYFALVRCVDVDRLIQPRSVQKRRSRRREGGHYFSRL